VDVTPYSLVEIWQRFKGICWFHFQGTAVPSRGTLLCRIKVSAGVGDELPVARYCLLMRCVQVRHTAIQLPVMLISLFSGTDEEDERRPECDFSGAGVTRVTSLSTVAVKGCLGRCKISMR
jgi:hypothetical protein